MISVIAGLGMVQAKAQIEPYSATEPQSARKILQQEIVLWQAEFSRGFFYWYNSNDVYSSSNLLNQVSTGAFIEFVAMDVWKKANLILLAARFLGTLPATAIFVYLGLVAIPVLAVIDIFIDFPRGDQDWKVYLMYWPTTMLFGALLGLLADVFERLTSGKGKRKDVRTPN